MLDTSTLNRLEETRAKYAFLTFLVMGEENLRVGIVQNETPKLVMFYDFDKIREVRAKERFLNFADEWWWHSNQKIPVDSFIGYDFEEFRHVLTGYPKKAIDDLIGPTFSLQELYLKRVKKKKIEIVNTVAIATA